MPEKRSTKDSECPNNFISFIYEDKEVLTTDEVVECLNNLHEENQALKRANNNRRVLLVDELRGLFQMYITQCRSISEEAIITLIRNDVKKRVFEVFDDD